MSSPEGGKTTLLKTLRELQDDFKLAVMEADIDSVVDAHTMQNAGSPAIQLHTGGMCHLDADMSRQGLKELGEGYDIVFLENVGNLVCPAEFDTEAHLNVCVLSIPEGDAKLLKYPLMFEVANVVLINKIDTKSYFTFDDEKIIENIRLRNKEYPIFFVSTKTGEGFKPWISWLESQIEK